MAESSASSESSDDERIRLKPKKYTEMTEIALKELNEPRSGSSRQEILKYITANYDVGERAGRFVNLAIKKLLEEDRIVRKSGTGSIGRFTLSRNVREEMRKGVKPKKKPKPKSKSTTREKDPKANAAEKGKQRGKGEEAKAISYNFRNCNVNISIDN